MVNRLCYGDTFHALGFVTKELPGGLAENGNELHPKHPVSAQGVLFFELFNPLLSPQERMHTLSGLRHRILPMNLLQGRPQEAAFVLSLLHPDPSARPIAAKIMRPECLSALQKSICKPQVCDTFPQ